LQGNWSKLFRGLIPGEQDFLDPATEASIGQNRAIRANAVDKVPVLTDPWIFFCIEMNAVSALVERHPFKPWRDPSIRQNFLLDSSLAINAQ
jgi:hypothetical protein